MFMDELAYVLRSGSMALIRIDISQPAQYPRLLYHVKE